MSASLSGPATSARISIAEKHLRAYTSEGHALDMALLKIERLRKRIEGNPLIQIEFGSVRGEGFSAPTDYNHDGTIVLGDAAMLATMHDVTEGSARATEIAGPGLRACLLMWLAEWERKAKTARDAWTARDPLAEAVALADASVAS